MSRFYGLHDLTIAATSDHSLVEKALDRTLRYKGARPLSGAQAAGIRLHFNCSGTTPWPASAQHVGNDERVGVGVWKTQDRMHLRLDDSIVHCDPEAGTSQAVLSGAVLNAHEDQRRSPLFYLITLSLVILLRYRGWYPLHAAALADGNRGVLLVAPSDRGKSTAALTLVRAGWSFLSDDTVLLRRENEEIQAYSFRRNFCVDPDAAEHFPELGGQEWPSSLSDALKWQVDVGTVYSGSFQPECTPQVLLLPEITGAPRSRVEPADPKTVLSALLTQGAFFLAAGRNDAGAHLNLLGDLVRQSRAYHLRAGRDVRGDPEALDTLLRPLIEKGVG